MKEKQYIVTGTVTLRFRVDDGDVWARDEGGACDYALENLLDFAYSTVVEDTLEAKEVTHD